MKLVLYPPKGPEWAAVLRESAPGVELVEAAEPEVADAIRTAEAFYGTIQPDWFAAARRTIEVNDH